MISGAVTVLLADDPGDCNSDRRRLDVLARCPDGARVIVQIGRRSLISPDAVSWLYRHDHRLDIEIQGADPSHVRDFIKAARAGNWESS